MNPSELSSWGIGTWGVAGHLARDQASNSSAQRRAIRFAFEQGANWVDCSLKYAEGQAVKVVAEALGPVSDQVLFAAKAEAGISHPRDLRHQVEQYLRTLPCEALGVLSLHARSFSSMSVADTYDAMVELVREGKVQHLGVSNLSLADLQTAMSVAGEHIIAYESVYCLEVQALADSGHLDYCNQEGIQVWANQPLRRGRLGSEAQAVLNRVVEASGLNESESQIAWLCGLGLRPMLRSDSEAHIANNARAATERLPADLHKLMVDFRRSDLATYRVDWDETGEGIPIYQLANYLDK